LLTSVFKSSNPPLRLEFVAMLRFKLLISVFNTLNLPLLYFPLWEDTDFFSQAKKRQGRNTARSGLQKKKKIQAQAQRQVRDGHV
jgi:hypothetical protein